MQDQLQPSHLNPAVPHPLAVLPVLPLTVDQWTFNIQPESEPHTLNVSEGALENPKCQQK